MRIRDWQLGDLENLVRYAGNFKVARFMCDGFPHPYTEADGRAFIERASTRASAHLFAIDLDGEAIGGIGLHPQGDIHRLNAELGYWLAEPYWGRGIVTEAILEIVNYGFRNLEINRIFARPFGTNPASQRVLEKAGFSLEAKYRNTLIKNGMLIDELIYAIRREA